MDSNVPQSSFPKFSSGDTLITLSLDRQYQLHSTILRQRSTYFRRVLTEDFASLLPRSIRGSGKVVVHRLDLVLPKDESDDPNGGFHVRKYDGLGRLDPRQQVLDVENGKTPSPLYQHYDNIFRAYYDQPLTLHDSNMAHILPDIIGLVDVAEKLGSMRVVSASAANALLQHGQTLFRSIAANAVGWADLAYRLESPLLFREAVIHMVGQWPTLEQDPHLGVRAPIRALCTAKHTALDAAKRAVETRVLGYYPPALLRSQARPASQISTAVGPGSRGGGPRSRDTRMQSYATDVFAWMALGLFRHFVGQYVAGGQTRLGSDGGRVFYAAVGAAGRDSYLDREDVDRFCRQCPLSSKGRAAFDEQLLMLKQAVAPFMQGLLVSRCQLDVDKYPVAWLTCCEVDKAELPWASGEDATRKRKRGIGDFE